MSTIQPHKVLDNQPLVDDVDVPPGQRRARQSPQGVGGDWSPLFPPAHQHSLSGLWVGQRFGHPERVFIVNSREIQHMRNATILAVAIIIVVGGVVVWGALNRRGPLTPPVVEVESLTEVACEAVGGDWEGCGSACRETPDAVCIQVCVEYCLCKSDVECPDGYACGRFVEGNGICEPV